MQKSSPGSSDAVGGLRYLLYEPTDTGMDAVTFGAGAIITTSILPVTGYHHFQVWIESTSTSLNVDVRLVGVHPISKALTNTINIGQFAPGPSFVRTTYFGIGRTTIASVDGDRVSVGRFILFSVENQAGASRVISLSLECFG